MSSVPATALTIALCVVMGLAAQTSVLLPVLATVLVVQVLIATAPAPADARGRAIPTPQAAPVLTAGLIAAAVAYHPMFLLGAGTRAGIEGLATSVYAGVLPGVAIGLWASVVAQILRKDGRPLLVPSLAAVVALCVFAATATAWISAARAASGRGVVTLACVGMVAALLTWTIPASRFAVAPMALAAGAVAAGAWTLWNPGGSMGAPPWSFAAGVGAAAGGFALVGLVVGRAWAAGRMHRSADWGLPGALAFALTGPLVYVACDLVNAVA